MFQKVSKCESRPPPGIKGDLEYNLRSGPLDPDQITLTDFIARSHFSTTNKVNHTFGTKFFSWFFSIEIDSIHSTEGVGKHKAITHHKIKILELHYETRSQGLDI